MFLKQALIPVLILAACSSIAGQAGTSAAKYRNSRKAPSRQARDLRSTTRSARQFINTSIRDKARPCTYNKSDGHFQPTFHHGKPSQTSDRTVLSSTAHLTPTRREGI